jgi:hypothetical protein
MSIVQLTAEVDNVPALVAATDAKLDGLALGLSDGAVGVDMPQALTSTAAVAISKLRVPVISAAPIRRPAREDRSAHRLLHGPPPSPEDNDPGKC